MTDEDRAAALVICSRAHDADDARVMLQAAGLLPSEPTPDGMRTPTGRARVSTELRNAPGHSMLQGNSTARVLTREETDHG